MIVIWLALFAGIMPAKEGLAQPAPLGNTVGQPLNAADAPRASPSSAPRPSNQRLEIPKPPPAAGVTLEGEREAVDLTAREADIAGLLQMIAEYHQLNLILGPNVTGRATVSLQNSSLEEVLDAILTINGFTWHQQGRSIYVTKLESETAMDPRLQGRAVQVFPLNFVAASDVQTVVTGILSPVGQAFISESNSKDQKHTREAIVVEDLPGHLDRIAQYIAQVDQSPRQVLIEAHVLQIALTDDMRHGINLEALARVQGADITLKTDRMAETSSAGPEMTLQLDGTDLNGLVEMIQQNGNTRTLASPKVMVVNHQEAKIQIGSQFGYFVATTTQTATVQSVNFLDVGVVLTVTPVISDDGQILMTVMPKVSGGRVNPATGLPEEDTTEVNTTVLLPDGGGVIIGGLIKEKVDDQQARVPYLSRIPLVGRLFRRYSNSTRRDEIVIALVAKVVCDPCAVRAHEQQELMHTLPPYASESLR